MSCLISVGGRLGTVKPFKKVSWRVIGKARTTSTVAMKNDVCCCGREVARVPEFFLSVFFVNLVV